ncbi:MAG: hypothetical protein JNL74_17970 [Fibrobacteres bacterium]|nr:hypothetical protein [Fibrobacterota bacterium]
MRRILWFIFIYIISLVMITHGVVLTGTVKSINSQISIPNASITFRLGREVALYPVAFTDSNGFFNS